MTARRRLAWQMRLPLPWTLALRYGRSARRDAYVSFLSLLATGGIALGVAALILVLAGLAGLQDFLRSDVLARTPQIEVELPPGAAAAVRDRVAGAAGVREARLLLRGRGWILLDRRAVAVEIIGYEGELPSFFPDASDRRQGLYVDDRRALAWGLEPGDLVDVVSPRPTLTPLGPQPRIHRLRLTGTFAAGRTEEEEQRIALPLEVAARLLGERQLRLEVRTADLATALEVARRLPPVLPAGSRVKSWQDLNRPLFFALRLEKALMFAAVFLIVPVAALSLVTVLVLLISSKRGEIGMLLAMGARPEELRRAFLRLGALLAAAGLAVGGTAGCTLAWLFDRYRLIAPFGDLYYLDHIPFHLAARDLAAVLASTALLTLLAAAYAAHRAASLPAVEVLRQ